MIGYECFVGLITKKGDIYLKEAGYNCERNQEPLKYGMRLTQVSKCYVNPRLSWTTTLQPAKRPKATALPRWRERELNNFIDSGGASISTKTTLPMLSLWLVTFVSYLFTCSWRWNSSNPNNYSNGIFLYKNVVVTTMAVNVQELTFQKETQISKKKKNIERRVEKKWYSAYYYIYFSTKTTKEICDLWHIYTIIRIILWTTSFNFW